MEHDETFSVRFWGVRGSHPAPGPATVRYGGNTACVEVQAGGQTLILDAGTGLIPLGHDLAGRARRAARPLEVTLLLSHLHHDHTQGFPFFAPAYLPTARLHVFGPGASPEALEKLLENNQNPPAFPVSLRDMAACKDIRSLTEAESIVLDSQGIRLEPASASLPEEAVQVRIHRSYAHPGGVYAYRVEWRGLSLVYATDTEGYVGNDRRLAHFARRTSLLIHDAQYSEEHYRGQVPGLPATQGYGHSTAAMACELAAAAEAGGLVLFHHDPGYDDAAVAANEAAARALFPATVAAYEGLEITLGQGPRPVVPRRLELRLDAQVAQGG